MHEFNFFLILLINLPILFFYNSITKKLNFFDLSDGSRKFQEKPVPLIGGFLLIYNILVFQILSLNDVFGYDINEYFSNTRELFGFYLGLLFCFFVGAFDDKYDLSATKKLFINFFIIFLIILLDENLIIRELNFSFFENKIELRNISTLFTILCFLLLINAINMFDGINLQVGIYCLIIFSIFIIKNLFPILSLIVIISLIIFLYYNFKNKAYLGDSGTQSLAFIISYIFIKSYNENFAFRPEEIFILLAIPGLDMFRLFIFRIIKGKNPFSADLNHMHHLILRKYNSFIALIVISILILINIGIYYLIANKAFVLLVTLLSYIFLLIFFRKQIRK